MKHQSEESAKNHGEWRAYKAKQKSIEPKRIKERTKEEKRREKKNTHSFIHWDGS